jgi:hypothetical protein
LPDHPGLHGDEARGDDQAGDDHPEAKAELLYRLWEDQPLGRLKGERESSAGEEGGLREAGDCLALAVTEAVLVVGRALGVAHAEEGGESGGRVHEGVYGRGEQRN